MVHQQRALKLKYYQIVLLSLVIHLFTLGLVDYLSAPQEEKKKKVVTVTLVEEEKKSPITEPPPPLPPPPPKPKPKPKVSERKPKEEPKKESLPVQGLSPEAVSDKNKGIAAPLGNTMLVGDEGKGKRLKASEVQALSNEDLSAAARLIKSSIETPKYTEDALDAGLEGTFIVDVYVDKTGKVNSAELRKKVGYKMDPLLISTAMKARFEPQRDRFGQPIAGWADITFRLELP